VTVGELSNRKIRFPFQNNLHLRHLLENAFLHLKCWQGIATRYAKNAASFLAAVQIRRIALRANVL
jgi:transposase